MKKILSILALIIIISGCGLNQDANNSNTESNTKSSSESTQDSSKMANLDNYLTAAKQALSVGDYNKAIEESTVAIKLMPIMLKPILFAALQQRSMAIPLKAWSIRRKLMI